MVKCESLRINMFRITHTGKSVNFPVTKSSRGVENKKKIEIFQTLPEHRYEWP